MWELKPGLRYRYSHRSCCRKNKVNVSSFVCTSFPRYRGSFLRFVVGICVTSIPEDKLLSRRQECNHPAVLVDLLLFKHLFSPAISTSSEAMISSINFSSERVVLSYGVLRRSRGLGRCNVSFQATMLPSRESVQMRAEQLSSRHWTRRSSGSVEN